MDVDTQSIVTVKLMLSVTLRHILNPRLPTVGLIRPIEAVLEAITPVDPVYTLGAAIAQLVRCGVTGRHCGAVQLEHSTLTVWLTVWLTVCLGSSLCGLLCVYVCVCVGGKLCGVLCV